MRTTLSSARRGWPATSNKKNQRYGKDDQSDRTNDQSQQLGEKRDIRRCHRLWPLSDEVAQIMQGLSERAENRSNCYQSADDHRYRLIRLRRRETEFMRSNDKGQPPRKFSRVSYTRWTGPVLSNFAHESPAKFSAR